MMRCARTSIICAWVHCCSDLCVAVSMNYVSMGLNWIAARNAAMEVWVGAVASVKQRWIELAPTEASAAVDVGVPSCNAQSVGSGIPYTSTGEGDSVGDVVEDDATLGLGFLRLRKKSSTPITPIFWLKNLGACLPRVSRKWSFNPCWWTQILRTLSWIILLLPKAWKCC